MLQTTVANVNEVSEPLPEIELQTSDIGLDEIAQLIKNEEVGAALQIILNHITNIVFTRVRARMGTVRAVKSTIVAPKAKIETSVSTAVASSAPAIRKKREVTPEVRKKISESQKAKWATRPRQQSAEVKQKISESQRARWATRNGTTLPLNSPREASTSTEADCQPRRNKSIVDETAKAVISEAVLASRDGYKGDPFYISFDGHFIGDDGFVVPSDFTEFLDRYPRYLENWVRRRLNGQGIEQDIEDWVHDLIIHMKYLPLKSKHRKLGKDDVIQTFDPFAQYGASERRWRNYINYCLANKYNTTHGKRMKNPVCRTGNLSLVAETNPDVHGEVTDEYLYGKSEYLVAATNREEKRQGDIFFAHKFIEFVQEHDPNVFPVLEAVYEAGSSSDTIKEFCQTCQRLATTKELKDGEHKDHDIGMSQKEFNRARNRLKQLAGLFIKQRNRKVKTS